jgi:hypothetical protein
MRKRLRAAALLPVLVIGLWAAAVSAASAGPDPTTLAGAVISPPNDTAPATVLPCGPEGARTIASDRVARVYASRGVAYGCSSVSGGRSFKLGLAGGVAGPTNVDKVSIVGTVSAYESYEFGIDCSAAKIAVTRLSDGKLLRSAPAINAAVLCPGGDAVNSLVVKADGSVAWIGTGGPVLGPASQAVTEVHKLDRTGAHLLARAADIVPASLRLRGSKLTWKRDGRTYSATLS